MVLFYVLIVCTVTLPPGVNPIAVDKYIYLILAGERLETYAFDRAVTGSGIFVSGCVSLVYFPQNMSHSYHLSRKFI